MVNHIYCINPLSIQVVLILAVSETSFRVHHTLSRQSYSYLTFGHIQKVAVYNYVQIIHIRRSYDHICLVSTVLCTYGSTILNHSIHFSYSCITVTEFHITMDGTIACCLMLYLTNFWQTP
jgi:hypothetical protein